VGLAEVHRFIGWMNDFVGPFAVGLAEVHRFIGWMNDFVGPRVIPNSLLFCRSNFTLVL